jgi:CRISPR-associated protein Cmr4
MNARLLFIHAFSPLHAGTGQAVGAIDLPVAREKATGLPYLPGSSLKGVLREACPDEELRRCVFGPEPSHASDYAGSVQISDQRLLVLPVRSLKGTFAWVTAPFILRRFLRDAGCAAVSGLPTAVPSPAGVRSCLVPGNAEVIVHNGRVILEDLDLDGQDDAGTQAWAAWIGGQVFADDPDWQAVFTARFCVVHDDVLGFLLETATEITARIRLQEEAKTVQEGGLWYEEALPAETVLSGLIVATPVMAEADEVFRTLADLVAGPLQLGGKATVGRGLCRLRLTGGVSRADT